MKKRIVSLIAILALLVVAFVVATPDNKAQATVYWPQIFVGTSVLNVVAHSEDDLSLVACGSSGDNGQYVKAGVQVTNDTWNGGGAYQCDLALGAAQNDGTFYAYTNNGGYTSTSLVAYKNGIQLWSTSIGYTSNCASGYNDYTAQIGAMTSSIGLDGNLYFVITPGAGYSSCQDRMLKVEPSTGAKLFDINLGVAPGPGLGYAASDMRMWTYDSKIVLMDRNDTLREFSYSGVENTSASYTFPRPTGNTIYQVTANAAGTVFAAASYNGYPHQASVIMWHKANGTHGEIDSPSDNYLNPILAASGIGNVSAAFDNYVHRYDVAANSYVDTSFNVPSGYSAQQVMGYMEDTSGHGLLIRNFHNSSWTSLAVSVDLVDYTTSTPTFTNLFLQDGTSSPSASPQTYPLKTEFQLGIADGYLYLPTCTSGGSCSTSSPEAVQKIALTGFGTPQSDTPKRNGYTKSRYVALGDSFSSGEGVTPFLPDSNVSGTGGNQCHRSKEAYPEVLATMSLPALNLTNFLACSGDTTYNVLTADQYGVASQISRMPSNTQVATITIGGNDMGFQAYATACVLGDCSETSTAYATAVSNIGSMETPLENTYNAILAKLTTTGTLYVVDYPMVVPTGKEWTDLQDPDCPYLYNGATQAEDIVSTDRWGNGIAAEDIIARLNARIETAVDAVHESDSRIQLVDVSGDFAGHDICSSDNDFISNVLSGGAFHPNQNGHLVIANALATAMS